MRLDDGRPVWHGAARLSAVHLEVSEDAEVHGAKEVVHGAVIASVDPRKHLPRNTLGVDSCGGS